MPALIDAEKERIEKAWDTGDDADRSVGSFLTTHLVKGTSQRTR